MKIAASNKFLVVLFASVGAVFLWLAGFEAYSRWLMSYDKATIQATVTSARHNPCTGRGCSDVKYPYQVRYRFSLPGSDRYYTYTGQWLLNEMWVRVPKSVYVTAQTSNIINVAYAATNPRINRPAVNPVKPAYEWMGFLAFAILNFSVMWLVAKSSNPAFKRDALKRAP